MQGVTVGGNFSPNAPATRELVAAMLYYMAEAEGVTLPTTRTAITFTDQEDITSLNAVRALYRAGVINGYAETNGFSFRPNGTITRAEIAAMMDRFMSLT
jgi:hypothetical protein